MWCTAMYLAMQTMAWQVQKLPGESHSMLFRASESACHFHSLALSQPGSASTVSMSSSARALVAFVGGQQPWQSMLQGMTLGRRRRTATSAAVSGATTPSGTPASSTTGTGRFSDTCCPTSDGGSKSTGAAPLVVPLHDPHSAYPRALLQVLLDSPRSSSVSTFVSHIVDSLRLYEHNAH